ncbi:MAG TPA: 50S ribosomal protein L29 [Candidatus Woesearchaeota archaeon]|nr:MAG: 50S ribosomal protein L29 [Candidatus Woesearchaeota archaeon]HDD70636.1 50S ribosomal protein L29 [Candidatus Woesearchaeota archaeon]
MKIKELRSFSVDELSKKKTELQKELMKEMAMLSTGTIPKSPGKIRAMKKTIARIIKILADKEEKQKA